MAERIKIAVAALIAVGGLFAYYALADQALVVSCSLITSAWSASA